MTTEPAKFDDTVAGFRAVWGYMTRNLVRPERTCNYHRRTLAGARNRWLRDQGRGEPTWKIEDRQYLFEGFDAQDYYEFRLMLREKLPYAFSYEDMWETEVADWIDEHTVGEFRHTFNPMFVTGQVCFADPNEAFFFKIAKVRENTDIRKVAEIKPEDILPVDTIRGDLVERICLRTYFSVVAYLKSWIGGRDEPVRSR